jgi:hypothetical protein
MFLKNLFKQCILIFLNFQLSILISLFLCGVANLAMTAHPGSRLWSFTSMPSWCSDVVYETEKAVLKEGGSMFLQNICVYLQVCMVSVRKTSINNFKISL